MAKKSQDIQRAIHYYRRQTGKTEVDMREVVEFAIKHLGWPVPEPVDPIELLTRQFSRAAREETKVDTNTGRPYRVNHAVPYIEDGQVRFTWADIDTVTRPRMHKAIQHRREQTVGDVTMMVFDAEHWNSINPSEEPIQIELDFGPDVEWRKNSADETDDAG